ncbi:MAG TPA: hypothetical protein DCM28_19880 [Phycisphaerales bacterium]|nr:hypothetical protein [Phycisphaerales bacterium]HCD31774.1 hypothetical protein [Phycisphaerales bacterium]
MSEIKWMQDGPFGVMVHYIKGVQPRSGKLNPDFNAMVEQFDVSRLIQQVAQTGAKWLFFTFGQNTGFYCSPNAYLESLIPGCCSRRDLMGEVADAAHAHGLKLIAYLPAEIDLQTDAFRSALAWDSSGPGKQEFQKRYMRVIADWSLRLGNRIDGWFFDGCYDAKDKGFMRTHDWDNARFDPQLWAEALRAGNPDAVFTMNAGVGYLHSVLPNQDFISGEFNDLSFVPDGPTSFGMQNQVLTWLDCRWLHTESPGPIPPPRFTDQQLFTYVEQHRRVGSAVTLNIGIYEDGQLSQPSLKQLKRLDAYLAQTCV